MQIIVNIYIYISSLTVVSLFSFHSVNFSGIISYSTLYLYNHNDVGAVYAYKINVIKIKNA